jgi:hypothetical protein
MNPAFPEPLPPPETGLIIQRGAAFVTLHQAAPPALSEMISRSLVHLQPSKALAAPDLHPGEECDFEIAPGVMMRMCWIPPGEFLMGSHLVTTGNQLKIHANDGKRGPKAAASSEALLRRAQSVPRSKATLTTQPILCKT